MARFCWRRESLNFTACCRQRKVPFSGSSPYQNYNHGCGYFSFVRFLSVAWPYNYHTHNFSCGRILIHEWPCYTTAGHWSTQQAFLMYTNTFLLAVSLHLRSQMVFPSMDSAQMIPHQNAFCTLVYMIKCIMYLICVLYRMQWVLLYTPLASLMYFVVHRISIWEPQHTWTSVLTSN